MNYEETVNFIKLFLLLMNGGTFILRTLVHKLILESGKSLDDLLLQSRDLFEDKLKKNRKQFDLLFPGRSQHADIEQWDISLLTFVLLNMFKGLLDSKQMDAIKVIRDHRNKILAHNAKSEMTLKDFMSAWYQVSDALTDLSRNTATPEDQKELKDIESSIFKDPFQKDVIGQLKEMGQTDTLVHAVIEKFMPLVNDKIEECEKKNQKEIEKCVERLEDLEKEQKRQGDKIALLVRMKVNTGRTRSRRKVQEHILEASRDIISTEGTAVNSSDDETLAAVRDLFEGIEMQGVKIVKADKGSILFTILCPTIKSLIYLTHYLNSPEIQPKLSYIETTVKKRHNCRANIAIDVDLNSLHSAIKEIENELDNATVYLTLECDGAAGVRNAFHTFGSNESTNTLLSEAFSRTVGEQVEIQTDIDIDKMKGTTEKNNTENKLREKERHVLKEVSKEKDQEMQTLDKDSLMQEQKRGGLEELMDSLVVRLQKERKQGIQKTDSVRPEKQFDKSVQQLTASEADTHLLERHKIENQLRLLQTLETGDKYSPKSQLELLEQYLESLEGNKYSPKRQQELLEQYLESLKGDKYSPKRKLELLEQYLESLEADTYLLERHKIENQIRLPQILEMERRIINELRKEEERKQRAFIIGNSLGSAAAGAVMGAPFGPSGMAIGGTIGFLIGAWFSKR